LPFYPTFEHWLWLIPAFLLGSCIGSFLNVVIYRVPLGLSVNKPNRSFCPKCKSPIPFRRNIPLFSWLSLRGKCGDCKAPIPARYFVVELVTALLFTAAWWVFASPMVGGISAIPFLWLLIALLVSITWIDAEHMIIPVGLTWIGMAAGLVACALWPELSALGDNGAGTWVDGLKRSAIGLVVGYAGLRVVVELGKLAFGKLDKKFPSPVAWKIQEGPDDDSPMEFLIEEETIQWWDIFSRKTDRLIIDAETIILDGESLPGGTLTVRELDFTLPDGAVRVFLDIRSLEGTGTRAVIPREAMGMGDPPLLGMIGAFFGWPGVFFSLFSASVYATILALITRIGFGKPLPFGPFLAMGAVTWMFGGWKLWQWYLTLLGPMDIALGR
jgi:leader peptidase (prepilin peptidase)/N-methyltransferase